MKKLFTKNIYIALISGFFIFSFVNLFFVKGAEAAVLTPAWFSTVQAKWDMESSYTDLTKAFAALMDCKTFESESDFQGIADQVQESTIVDKYFLGTGVDMAGTKNAIQMMQDNAKADASMNCQTEAAKYTAAMNAYTTKESDYKKALTTSEKETWEDITATAFNKMKTQLFLTFAEKSATYLASAATGQKPLYYTEGIEQLLINTGDAAVGAFIDSVSKDIKVDLCSPDFNVQVGISLGLAQKAPKPKCTALKMFNNWKTASKNANFSFDYNSSLSVNNTEMGYFLVKNSELNQYVSQKKINDTINYGLAAGFKPIQNYAKEILTPAPVNQDKANKIGDAATKSYTEKVFTGTGADVYNALGIFLSTFISQTVSYYANGMFHPSNSNSSNSSGSGVAVRSNSNVILNSQASPENNNEQAAQENSLKYFKDNGKVGSRDDILIKLSQCQDVTNPGPTDCVIDAELYNAISSHKLVSDLPDNIKNRKFAPKINNVNSLNTEISLRSVIILRQYRIVPVGWEIAAEYLSKQDRVYTLGDLINSFDASVPNFNGDANLINLVDPYWVLKSPDVFCRRVGYGPNASNGDQIVRKDGYCADPQQCLEEDDKGNCLSYGYCTEEARIFNFGGQKCQPRYNTCTTFQSRQGQVQSYLANTLDYRYCNAGNVGCSWYSTAYNTVDNYWEHSATSTELTECVSPDGCQVGTIHDSIVEQWNSVSDYGYITMDKPCNEPNGCHFNDATCTVPFMGIRCRIDGCNNEDILTGMNGDFKSCGSGSKSWDAATWDEDGSHSYNLNNNFSCTVGQGRTNNAFRLLSSANNSEFFADLKGIGMATGTNYKLSFYTKGNLGGLGGVKVEVVSGNNFTGSSLGSVVLDTTNVNDYWQQYSFTFQNQNDLTGIIKITSLDQTSANVLFDDFKLEQIDQNCTANPVWLSLGYGSVDPNNNQRIDLDRDAATCDAQDAGCSQFIRTKAGLSSDLIPNGGFEDWANGLPVGWTNVSWKNWNMPVNSSTVSRSSVSSEGQGSAMIGNGLGKVNGIATPKIAIRPDANYILSGEWSGVSSIATTSISFRFFDASGDELSSSSMESMFYNGQHNVSYTNKLNYNDGLSGPWYSDNYLAVGYWNATLGQNFQQFQSTFKTTGDAFYVQIAFQTYDGSNVPSPQNYFYLDSLKLEEVPYNATLPTLLSSYSSYDPSQRNGVVSTTYGGSLDLSSQVTYLKKAPDYYHCYTDSYGDWPVDQASLLKVLNQSSSSPECLKYTPVCSSDEVGCEAYTPENGDPTIPGIARQSDICPSECIGYQVYKQEPTDFISSRYVRFIADNKLKYCSAQEAGCDEFTNLDNVSSGGEQREYYTSLKACQKSDGVTDGVFYTWEGSDTKGYQLKVYNLKISQSDSLNPHAPCTNLYYHDDGSNYCGDVTSTPGDLNNILQPALNATHQPGLSGYLSYLQNNETITSSTILNQPIANALHNYGICLKQEIRGYATTTYTTSTVVISPGTIAVVTTVDFVSISQNPNCKEFYDVNGDISYKLISDAVTVSDDCHPYRRTKTQNNDYMAMSDCQVNHGWWTGSNVANTARTSNECVYMAIPGEGTICSKDAVGCREFSGNKANNVANISFDDFEVANSVWSNESYWDGGILSTESNYPGGESFKGTGGSISRLLADSGGNSLIEKNKSYILSFWAKSSSTSGFNFKSIGLAGSSTINYFSNIDESSTYPTVKVDGEWRYYELGPIFVTNIDKGSYKLKFQLESDTDVVFLDNVLLKEVKDDIFAIENTWFTPFSCDNDLMDPSGQNAYSANVSPYCATAGDPSNLRRCLPGWMIGCEAYKDRSDAEFNLKSFSNLCRPKAVGCEAMIDTHNSNSPVAQTFNSGNAAEVTVATDSMAYLVNDGQYQCSADNKGCTSYGLPKITTRDEVVGYDNVYLKNNPDRYSTDLCKDEELWCDEFTSDRSTSYFKNPRGKLCQYKAINNVYNWYKTDSNEICSSTPYQTIGYGVAKEKLQPLGVFDNFNNTTDANYNGWVGSCSSDSNGCTEYIDPLANMYTTLVYDGNFQQNVLGKQYPPDGWTLDDPSNVTSSTISQTVKLDLDTLYTLFARNSYVIKLMCSSTEVSFWSPDNSAVISTTTSQTIITLPRTNGVTSEASTRFYLVAPASSNKRQTKCAIQANGSGVRYQGAEELVKLVKTGVYYYQSGTVNRTDCNGQVDYKNGCVLFNERNAVDYAVASSTRNYDYLKFGAQQTDIVVQPASPVSGNDSNSILRVTPDRKCAAWLYCASYSKPSVALSDAQTALAFNRNDKCLDLGLCRAIDEKGNCLNFNSEKDLNVYYRGLMDVNKSGYAKLGSYSLGIDGLLPFQSMYQIGTSAFVPNGGFESFDEKNDGDQPVGWYSDSSQDPLKAAQWKPEYFSVVVNPNQAYGDVAYLRLNGNNTVISTVVNLPENIDYTLTYAVNTQNLLPQDGTANFIITADPYRGSIFAGNDTVVASGKGWQRRSIILHVTGGGVQTVIRMKNVGATGGYSMIDSVEISPRLATTNQPISDDNLVSRSCRLYPTDNALSCNYISSGNFYSSWYGYCVMKDPLNPQNCLQWWPIDQVRGDNTDEVQTYQGQAPLYYCINDGKQSMFSKIYFGNEPINKGAEPSPTWFNNIHKWMLPGNDDGVKLTYPNNDSDIVVGYQRPSNTFLLKTGQELVAEFTNKVFTCDATCQAKFVNPGGECYIGNKITGFIPHGLGLEIPRFGTNRFVWTPKVLDPLSVGDEACFINGGSDSPDCMSKYSGNCDYPYNTTSSCEYLTRDYHGKDFIINDSVAGTNMNDCWTQANLAYFEGGGGGSKYEVYGRDAITGNWHLMMPNHGDRITQPPFFFMATVDFTNGQPFVANAFKVVCTKEDGYEGSPECDLTGLQWQNYITKGDNSSCQTIVKAVDEFGQGTPFFSRLIEGSPYVLPNGYRYGTDYDPYGTAVFNDQPETIDSNVNKEGSQPLIASIPDYNFPKPYQVRSGMMYGCYSAVDSASNLNIISGLIDSGMRMGFCAVSGYMCSLDNYPSMVCSKNDQCVVKPTPAESKADFQQYFTNSTCAYDASGKPTNNGTTTLGNLFAKDYGWWTWRDSEYIRNPVASAITPTNYAVVSPIVTSVQFNNYNVNGNASAFINTTSTVGRSTVMFSFNVIDSPEQLPLKKYTIDWGDGFNSENNASLSDKSDTSTPVEMYHFYDYWKVQSTATGANVNSCPPVMNGTCCDRDSFGNYCKVNAVVNVVDNWGATGSASALFTIYEDK